MGHNRHVQVAEDELETVVEHEHQKDERSRRLSGKNKDKARYNRDYDDEDDGWN